MKIKLLILLNLIALNCYGLDPATQQRAKDIIIKNDVIAMTQFLNEGIDVNSFVDAGLSGRLIYSLLGYAIISQSGDIAELLILRGANVDFGVPTNIASFTLERYKMRKLLIQHGAKYDPYDLSFLNHGICFEDWDFLRKLIENTEVLQTKVKEDLQDVNLYDYLKGKELPKDLIELLEQKREKEELTSALNRRDMRKLFDFLLAAIKKNDLEKVKFLIANGVKVLEKNRDWNGKTIFDLIEIDELPEAMRDLLKQQKDKEDEDYVILSLAQRVGNFKYSVLNNNLDRVRLFFKHGFRVLQQNEHGKPYFDEVIKYPDLSKEMKELLKQQKKKEEAAAHCLMQ